MKAIVFMGVLALFVLVQAPFILALDNEICENVSRQYESDCRDILRLDLDDDDKEYLIDHLGDRYSASDTPVYQSLFTDVPLEEEEEDYNPRENFENKFNSVAKMMIFFFINYSLYGGVKKYFGGALCNVV